MRQKRHMANCSGRPGVVYDFTNQNLISYSDNFRANGDVPFVIYFDFETTAPTDNCLDPEQKKMFVFLYVMVFAFNPELNLERIIIQRSFSHLIDQLTSLNNFTREQVIFIDQSLIKVLKYMAFEVAKRSCKYSIGQMFSIESALVKKTLLKWFNQKFYFMPFGDFVIRYEFKFLRNIYTEEQIKDSHHVKDLQSYYEIFEECILICIGLLALLNNFNRNDFINSATEKFVEDKFTGDEISEIKNTINKTEIKNALSTMHGNFPKFNLKIYGYVYDELLCFPRSNIDYETITTNKFFTNVHRLIRGKFHLYHSHITGKIFCYAHYFCNTTLVEK